MASKLITAFRSHLKSFQEARPSCNVLNINLCKIYLLTLQKQIYIYTSMPWWNCMQTTQSLLSKPTQTVHSVSGYLPVSIHVFNNNNNNNNNNNGAAPQCCAFCMSLPVRLHKCTDWWLCPMLYFSIFKLPLDYMYWGFKIIIIIRATAKQAADNKTAKYQGLEKMLFPSCHRDSAGSWSQQATEVVQEITEDSRETTFLFLRLSLAIQRGNVVSCGFWGTFPQN